MAPGVVHRRFASTRQFNVMPSSNFDLIDLCRRLKQEKLFVANERKEIEGLNRKVGDSAE